jgi:hypothetical protein
MTWHVPPPPPSRASHRTGGQRIALAVGIVFAAVVVAVGLYVVAMVVLFMVAMNSYGSNK